MRENWDSLLEYEIFFLKNAPWYWIIVQVITTVLMLVAPFWGGTERWMYALFAAAASISIATVLDIANTKKYGKLDYYPLKYVTMTTVIFSVIGVAMFLCVEFFQYLSALIAS